MMVDQAPPEILKPSEIQPDSQISEASSDNMPQYLSPDQVAPDKDYGTGIERAKTVAEGVASGPTFGLSRELESAVLHNSKEQAARIEENPVLSTASELGGILAAPEFGLVGAVGKAGQVAERAISPAAAKILGKTATKIASKAVGSAVEGAFYGAGNAVTEHALGNADLNAQNIIHNVGFGTILGGTLGAALGAGGKFISPEAETAASKEMHIENGLSSPETAPLAPPTSLEELTARNKQAEDMGFDGTLPAQDAVQKAQQNLVGDMTFLPHGAQIASLDNPESRLAYKMTLKSDTPVGQELRQYETNQKYEGSQKLIPEFIQDIAPDAKLTPDAYEGGQAAIKDFREQYDAAKAAETPNFAKLDNIQTNSVSNPQDMLKGIFEDLPGSKDLLGARQDGTYYLKPWAATSGMEKGAYSHFKEIIKSLNKKELSIGDIRNLRSTMRDAASNWEKPTEAFQVSQMRKNLMTYMQDQVQKVMPDAEVRDFMKRYAINEQNRGVIENIFGGSLDDKAKFGKAVEPEKVLPRIFSSLEDVKAAKALMGDKWNKTAANYLSHLHNVANDPISGFSSTKFSKAINDVKTGKHLILNEALSNSPEQLQKIRDVTTVMRGLPDSAPGNPSDTAAASKLLAQSRKWSSALLHPTELLGHIVSGVGNKLDEMSQRSAIDRMLSSRAEENFQAKAQKYNVFGKIERMQQQTMRTIKSGVNGIMDSSSGSGAKGLLIQKLTPEDQQKKFEKIASQINEASSNPEMAMNKMEEVTRDLYNIAPTLATKVGVTMSNATQFLKSKLPAQEPASPGAPPYKPSSSELAQFNRYYAAVNKPLDVLKHVQAGILTQESLEALQTVHPDLYKLMKVEMLDQFTSTKKQIPYGARIAMSMFLGQDLSNSLKPQNIAAAQMATPPPQSPPEVASGKSPVSQAGLKHLDRAKSMLTPMQKSTQKIE